MLYFDCFLNPITALEISCLAFSLLHSSQNFIVALWGLIVGSSIITLVGNREESPTIKASPISRIGKTSVRPERLSGRSLFITDWSSAFDNLNEIKLLH